MPYQHTSHGITVSVEVDYVPQEESGHDDRYLWAYHITLINGSDEVVQLKTRHWDIMDGLGRVQVVEGPGVVGEVPILRPGQAYTYSSGCPLPTPSGSMGGYYMFERDDGVALRVKIPDFSLDLPDIRRVLN
ncbi:Co2+/Mg2+ efflux protein ApaG [Asticcacaulis sp. AC402]|uniref:Co2+/Mg2+ efflux protein ApaG n=1 Tax=Asticcacaulis sp. AC402 TaxID=1282361 RepID=UPI0003C3B197|nr:Co2+/Mg2+ efflux protein ApaG [Asticcacaulis sp. AC402]ESQ77211.1 magnesium transporter ApaG [Asticcacaulis sp. AC402]